MFEANDGQADGHFKFIARMSGSRLLLAPTEAVMQMMPTTPGARPASLRMRLEGASRVTRLEGEDELVAKSNYLIGSDAKQWRSGVRTYASVRQRNIYRGVDAVYYGDQQQLEYDFRLAPGADFRVIKLSFDGARALRIDANGDLVLRTPAGEMRHRQPQVYQETNGIRKAVAVRYEIKGRSRIGFAIGAVTATAVPRIGPALRLRGLPSTLSASSVSATTRLIIFVDCLLMIFLLFFGPIPPRG